MNTQHKLIKLRTRRLRNITLNTICVILIVCGIVWIINSFWKYTQYEITNNAVVDQYITPVNIRVQGYIKHVNFTEHQRVKAGDTLLVLDDAEYQIKLMDAEAALMDAINNAAVLQSSINTSKSNIDVSEAQIKEAQIKVWRTEEDEKRYANLLQEKSVSLQQYERAKADYDEAKAKYSLLQKQKSSAELQSVEITKKSSSADAIIARRRADLEMCKLNLKYTVVITPYDGYVGRRTLGEGQFVQAGQTLTNIISDTKKWVTANYKETQMLNIYEGQEVNIIVDAYKGKTFKGIITAISEATGSKYSLIPTDNSAGNFVKVQQRIPVRIDFINLSNEDNGLLRAGMMVQTEAKRK